MSTFSPKNTMWSNISSPCDINGILQVIEFFAGVNKATSGIRKHSKRIDLICSAGCLDRKCGQILVQRICGAEAD
jgi:hypothetical protein